MNASRLSFPKDPRGKSILMALGLPVPEAGAAVGLSREKRL